MKRLALSAALLATLGLAAAASAGEQNDRDQVRSHSIQGRYLVWSEPKAEQPYALRGETPDAKSEKPRIELQSHGRSGTTVEINRTSDRDDDR